MAALSLRVPVAVIADGPALLQATTLTVGLDAVGADGAMLAAGSGGGKYHGVFCASFRKLTTEHKAAVHGAVGIRVWAG